MDPRRPISQLIVRIDEMLEDEIPPEDADLEAVLAHVRDLTSTRSLRIATWWP
jgi:hypothetical protein